MISSLSLVNFKCFQSIARDLNRLNVFAGVNGAGKSTMIQSLLAVRQSLKLGTRIDRLYLRGALTDLGTAAEVYCAEPCSDSVEITISHDEAPPIEIKSLQSKDQAPDSLERYYLSLTAPIVVNSTDLMSEPFNYLHAERVGPRKVSQIPSDEGHQLCVGKHGENAPYIIASEARNTGIENTFLLLPSSDGKEYPTLQFQCALWMDRLFPGFDEDWEIYREADQVRLGFSLQTQQTGQSLFVRPTNTGFGLSFVLGIIVAGLLARPDTILIVENPEAHLHPKAQSSLGEFLARAAAGGTQVFVETHSEHVLNGMRRIVKQAILTPEMVRILFFARDPKMLQPSVTPISISSSGEFSEWPDGFFDQLDKDLGVILT